MNKAVKRIAALLIIAAAVWLGYSYYQISSGTRHADRIIETLKDVIPNLGIDTGMSTGLGRDPLSQLEIDGLSIVGVLEVPSLEIMAPVLAKGQQEEGFAAIDSGSPVKGSFMLIGGRNDIFRRLEDAQPGDKVSFTDIEGIRYNYRVLTQFHLKSWDEADQDLMLCYQADDKTQFVLGCKLAD